MKLLLVHVRNEKELCCRGRFSGLLSYPSLTLAVLYSLISEGIFEKIVVIDENSRRVDHNKEKYNIVMLIYPVLLGANIGFKFLGIDKGAKK